ncbi:duf455 domain containing protein [Grosmannia clavigera kw1407]|uniref:Duf455 domain containing protein n=1 Tax=Grosmannia clavigera (strain kw1407 / UAMH 11150) TaxID=655863 RepID=F0XMM5_GROCL|nr:duf455 domain containing protein [Grosmannia clavigera kw1407]EFX00998.1 duf455 domain containing protein [Grosmannia clavigera kw1407]
MQGFNMGRYVPPEQEGVVASGNRLHGVRANKATAAGVPVVRFEMPFAVWCDGCEAKTAARHPVLIGQGVRFNAEKHRAGAYYSTPIWLFRMRHPACGTWLEIRTDPATTSYMVAQGGRRRREYDDDDGDEGAEGAGSDPQARAAASAAALAGLSAEEASLSLSSSSAADRASAFDRLERTIVHRVAVDSAAEAAHHRIDGLAADSARRWQDPYARNRALRAAFRAGRHAREQQAAADDDLRHRLGGLDLPLLLPPSEEDARRAALVDFGTDGTAAVHARSDRTVLAQPLFGGVGAGKTTGSTDKITTTTGSGNRFGTGTAVEKRRRAVRDHLAATVATNTRLKIDPFLDGLFDGRVGRRQTDTTATTTTTETPPAAGTIRLPGVKRKRALDDGPGPPACKSMPALVSYDSD